ncbi:peptidylprolyl isomerase [Helicobacter pametensis]|uniref:peptidylprolyl isomerase n=1 Tax=Helicobacter pametensis TaxID=95149 RepID=UPI0004B311F1|nr:peptidylprolyl isomerase [Helicobacter pametensis]
MRFAPFILLAPLVALASTLIDGIAFKVNNYPITIYELTQLQKEKKISKAQAKRLLILKAIKHQEAERLQIVADEVAIDKQIETAASMQGISRDKFIANMISSGYSYEELREFYKEQIQEELLTQRILSTNLKIIDEKELRKYFDEHKQEFTLPKEVVVVQYAAQNDKMLAQAINNPLIQTPGVNKREERISLSGINPQIAQMFAQTKKGQFTPVINNGGASLSFYIKEKIGSIVMPFDQMKPIIMQQVVLSRKDAILQEYFDRLITSALITNIRD